MSKSISMSRCKGKAEEMFQVINECALLGRKDISSTKQIEHWILFM